MRRVKVPKRVVIREQRQTIREQEVLIEWLLDRVPKRKEEVATHTPKETDDGHA